MKRKAKNKAAAGLLRLAAIAAALVFYLISRLVGGKQATLYTSSPLQPGDALEVHFIDVGQGDSALVVAPGGAAMLIDAGPNSAEEELRAYLNALGIKKFEYVVFTHPHEDHIGGGDMIMREYEVARVIMPDAVTATATFERLLDAIGKSGAEVICADDMLGETFTLGAGGESENGDSPQANFTILGPCAEYGELNNASVVLRLLYGEAEFLFTGDAEAESECDQLKKFGALALHCDVLKVGHHGSASSSTDEYILATSPQIAVISCAKINDYGHPHREVLERLGLIGAAVYTTADYGTIVIKTDGINIEAVTK